MPRCVFRALLAAVAGCATCASPAPRSSPAIAQAAQEPLDLATLGAVCDGRFDNSAAIARGLQRARAAGRVLFIPPGTCAYGDVIRVDSVALVGAGTDSVLYALDPDRSAIFLSGTAPAVRDLRLGGRRALARQAEWEKTRITVFGASGFEIARVIIDGAAAAGIQTADAAHHGRIVQNVVRDTLSDAIHITGMAHDITIEDNRIERSGDDGIAVVSYRHDAAPVTNIVARGNTVVDNLFGRNMSVVGGRNITYAGNHLQGNLASLACLYVAQEGGAQATRGVENVLAERNTATGCGGTFSHGAITLINDGDEQNRHVVFRRNLVHKVDGAGIRVRGAGNVGVLLDGNLVHAARRALAIDTPGVEVVPYSTGPVGAP